MQQGTYGRAKQGPKGRGQQGPERGPKGVAQVKGPRNYPREGPKQGAQQGPNEFSAPEPRAKLNCLHSDRLSPGNSGYSGARESLSLVGAALKGASPSSRLLSATHGIAPFGLAMCSECSAGWILS